MFNKPSQENGNTITQLKAGNLEIKLTSDKLFINTLTSSEAFALRSVNGIGVIDLVDDYNKALTAWKAKSNFPKLIMGFGGIMILAGLVSISDGGGAGLGMGIALIGIGYYFLNKANNTKPELMSAVRIMMSGGNRDFSFVKSGVQSGNVAEFVANVESTLTAYHKGKE